MGASPTNFPAVPKPCYRWCDVGRSCDVEGATPSGPALQFGSRAGQYPCYTLLQVSLGIQAIIQGSTRIQVSTITRNRSRVYPCARGSPAVVRQGALPDVEVRSHAHARY